MSVYVRLTSHSGEPRRIKKLTEYILDPCKTTPQNCLTYGVSKETVYQDMQFVKNLYRQADGRQCLHWVLSFEEGISENLATQVGSEVLLLLDGAYQAIAATHLNTKNTHVHFLINTVNVKTGKKFSESKQDMLEFRNKINMILRKYDIQEIGNVIAQDEDTWNLETEEEFQLSSDDKFMDYDSYEKSSVQYLMPHLESDCGKIQILSVFNGGIFQVIANIQSELTLIPGVYYEKEPVLRAGVTYDDMPETNSFNVIQSIDGTEYVGRGTVEEGRVLFPGILYENG